MLDIRSGRTDSVGTHPVQDETEMSRLEVESQVRAVCQTRAANFPFIVRHFAFGSSIGLGGKGRCSPEVGEEGTEVGVPKVIRRILDSIARRESTSIHKHQYRCFLVRAGDTAC